MDGIVGEGCRAGAPEIAQLLFVIGGEMDTNGVGFSTANGRQWTRIAGDGSRGLVRPKHGSDEALVGSREDGREWGGVFDREWTPMDANSGGWFEGAGAAQARER